MNRTMMKDIRRMISATKGRFFSLTAIVTIGVAFFVGVSSSSSIMSASVDQYDDSLNMKDITVYSNYGFDQEDLDAVKEMTDDVDNAELAKFVDVSAASGATNRITRIHSYRSDSQINQFVLKSGRLPENENECLSESGSDLVQGFEIGSTVTFSRPSDDLSDNLKVSGCQVVGKIDTPLYLDEAKENSTLSNQYINTYLYLPEEAFAADYYTEMNITLVNAKKYNSFSDEYEDYAKQEKEKIEELALHQKDHRHDVVVADAVQQYEDGLKDYQTAQNEYNTKIADGQKQIAESEQELSDGQQAIAEAVQKLLNSQQQLNTGNTDGAKKIADARAQLDQASAELAQQKNEFTKKKAELTQNIADIDDALAKIDTGITSLSDAKTGLQQIQSLKSVLAQSNQVLGVITAYQTAQPSLTDEKTIQELNQVIANDPAASAAQKQQTAALLNGSVKAMESIFSTAQAPVTITTIGQMKTYLQTAAAQQTVLQSQLDSQTAAIYQQLNDGLSLTGTGNELSSIEGLDACSLNLQTTKQDLLSKRQAIVDGIASGEQQLIDAQAKITQGYADAANGAAELTQQTDSAQTQINAGWAEINQKKAELASGKQQLETAKQELNQAITDGTQQLEDAKSKLEKAKQDIDSLAEGKWTVLDRTQHYSSAAYKNTVHQMSAIAAVFPVFFFMVAALVCLTTMTRMVDEQRGQIGIMRALGYKQRQCAGKYIIYAASATLIGCLVGTIAGMLIFPGIIYNAWRMMYILPDMKLVLSWPLFFLTAVCFMAVMILTTWYACHEDMKEVPAQLMRPKSPKLGRSTFIEKIPLLWQHFSFTWKVTVRNLIRYKKRFFMSVFGVAGCTALIITGFGIRDSIQTIATKQFEEIYQYDGTATFSDDLSASQINTLYETYSQRDIIGESVLLGAYNGKAYATDQDDETVYIQVFDQPEDIEKMYQLDVRESKKPITLNDAGVVISEKLAENLGKKAGDTITIESKDGVKKDATISAVCEMYVRHYIFMTKAYYKQIFGVTLGSNTMSVKLTGTSQENQAFQSELAASSDFSGVEFFASLLESFNQMIKGLDVIVLVLILSSASLAGVVLGNLTNVNISERMREIATLKVLGFRRKEVENYIYKENNILTLIGSLFGIPLGILLHHYIMHQVEMDYIMFGRNVSVWSCVICVLMTLGFGIIVNLMMAKHLRKIQMVESLKSVE